MITTGGALGWTGTRLGNDWGKGGRCGGGRSGRWWICGGAVPTLSGPGGPLAHELVEQRAAPRSLTGEKRIRWSQKNWARQRPTQRDPHPH